MCALATVLSEEGNKAVHCIKTRCINHAATVAAHGDKSGEAEPVKMKSKRVGGEAEPLRDLSRRHTVRPGLDKQTKDFQAVFLSKRGQGPNGG